jgi:hypothetical protein
MPLLAYLVAPLMLLTATPIAADDIFLDQRIQRAIDDVSNGFSNVPETKIGVWECRRSTSTAYECAAEGLNKSLLVAMNSIRNYMSSHLKARYEWHDDNSTRGVMISVGIPPEDSPRIVLRVMQLDEVNFNTRVSVVNCCAR